MGDEGLSRSGRGFGWYRPASVSMSALALAAAAVALGFAVVNRGAAVDLPVPGPAFVAVQLVSGAVWLAAAFVMLRRPDLAWSPLAALAGMSHAVAALGYGWAVFAATPGHQVAGLDVAVWLSAVMLPVEVPVVVWMTVTVPDGHLAPGRLGRVGAASAGLAALGVALSVVAPLDVVGTDVAGAANPLGGGWAVGGVAPLFIMLGTLMSDGVVVIRWRRATGSARLALRWIAVLSLGGLVVVPLVVAGPPGLGVAVAQVGSAVLILALLAAVYRHQLLGIDRVLDRSLRYLTLSALLALLYVALVAAGERVLGDEVGLFAAVAVALLALPLRDRLARSITRFVYGRRRDTQALVAEIARRTLLSGSPGDLLDDSLVSLSDGLDLEWAGVRALSQIGVAAEVGHPPADGSAVSRFDLVHRGRALGWLDVGRHRDGEDLDETDHAVLAEISPHLAMIVDSVVSATALRQARDRLVQAREEERRRLRHDLHDGLGPVLTGAALSTDAASNSLAGDADLARQLLAAVRSDLTAAIGEIRRIVENLRPPALDELGLAGALRQQAARFPALVVTVDVDVQPGELPAALEVGVFQIATEALTNAARHSGARCVTVAARVNGSLEVEITDDGIQRGVDRWEAGVGLESMADRASELGGTLAAGPTPSGGRVYSRIPLPAG